MTAPFVLVVLAAAADPLPPARVADGKLVPHPEQAAGLHLIPGSVLAETDVPNDNPLDASLDAGTAGSGFFGHAWSTPEAKALGKGLKTRGTVRFPQPKALDFGKPIKSWK